jgi:hypothetical protein
MPDLVLHFAGPLGDRFSCLGFGRIRIAYAGSCSLRQRSDPLLDQIDRLMIELIAAKRRHAPVRRGAAHAVKQDRFDVIPGDDELRRDIPFAGMKRFAADEVSDFERRGQPRIESGIVQARAMAGRAIHFQVRPQPVLDFGGFVVNRRQTWQFPRRRVAKSVFQDPQVPQAHELARLDAPLVIGDEPIELLVIEPST